MHDSMAREEGCYAVGEEALTWQSFFQRAGANIRGIFKEAKYCEHSRAESA